MQISLGDEISFSFLAIIVTDIDFLMYLGIICLKVVVPGISNII